MRSSALTLRLLTLLTLLAVLTLVTSVVAADGAPWRRRRIPGLRPNNIATARVTPDEWPAEPASPARIELPRLASALHEICGWMPPGRPEQYAAWLNQYATEFGEDPFLIGGLVYQQTNGGCRPDAEGEHGELGLGQIRRELYADDVRHGVYRYQVREAGRWTTREKRMDRFPFAGPRLVRAEEAFYFTAALLSAWRDQHASVDAAFEQVPHRHYVSHYLWGDRVMSDRDEDRVLTARRRLLTYYGAITEPRPLVKMEITMRAPLDGAPRVVSSGLGQERDGGVRAHRGIDVESIFGEPVRAIADGTVYFAGVDLPGHQSHQQVRGDGYDAYPRDSLGAGGRYVCLRHAREGDDVRSCYMHLETVEVEAGATLRRGEPLGTVGRTGMRSSAAHLHLEMYRGEQLLDASVILDGLLIGDPEAGW